MLQAAGQAHVHPYEALGFGLQVLVEAVAAKRVEEPAPLTTPTAWQSYRSDFNKDDEQLTLCDLPPSACCSASGASAGARLDKLRRKATPRSTLPFLVPFTWLVIAAVARHCRCALHARRAAAVLRLLSKQTVRRRLLNSIQAFDLPERRGSASPQPAPPPATLLPVYVMLPLDTVWPVERDGRKVRPGFGAPLDTLMFAGHPRLLSGGGVVNSSCFKTQEALQACRHLRWHSAACRACGAVESALETKCVVPCR